MVSASAVVVSKDCQLAEDLLNEQPCFLSAVPPFRSTGKAFCLNHPFLFEGLQGGQGRPECCGPTGGHDLPPGDH